MSADAEGWTPEREERLLALWAADWSAGRIAAELGGGLTRNAVIGKVHRLKGRPDAPYSPGKIQGSVNVETSPAGYAGDVRGGDFEKGADAGPSVEKAPATHSEAVPVRVAKPPKAKPAAAKPVTPPPAETPSVAVPAPANAIPSSGHISDADMERLFRGQEEARVGYGPTPYLDRRYDQCPALISRDEPYPYPTCCGEPLKLGAKWCEAHHKAFTVPTPKGISSALPQHRRSGVRLG